jgi:phosphatidylserine/phosphatidylglycerophosphate/cardiolipin synthase-like enzyme
MFSSIPTDEIRKLALAIESKHAECPVTRTSLQRLGLKELTRHADTLQVFDATTLPILLGAIINERASRNASPELVWTGPEGLLGASRSTEVIFKELLTSAQRSIWLTGYSIDHGKELFAPLVDAMRKHTLQVNFLINITYGKREQKLNDAGSSADFLINRFLQHNWPATDVVPNLYYDPRTIGATKDGKPIYASMHAKTMVIDEQTTLIGSANFTDRGQTRNIEAGVLLRDTAFAKQLVTQLQSLIDGHYIKRYGSRA